MRDFTFVSSRVRFARNLQGVNFPERLTKEEAERVVSRLLPLLEKRGYRTFRIADLSDNMRRVLLEQNLISKELCQAPAGAVATDPTETRAIMLMEEDVLRLTATERGKHLRRAYDGLSREELSLATELPFAFDKKFGYLTACVTNLGTGMRASVMVFLPALTRAGALSDLRTRLAAGGITVRGILGEGTEGENALYQLSNSRSIGVSEEEILSAVGRAAEEVRALELNARAAEFERNRYAAEDRFKRAEALLGAAVLLDYGEFMRALSEVKEGISLGVLTDRGVDLDDLMISMRPAHIEAMAREPLSAEEEAFFRAEYVRKTFRRAENR